MPLSIEGSVNHKISRTIGLREGRYGLLAEGTGVEGRGSGGE
jgi:hypothetical protein